MTTLISKIDLNFRFPGMASRVSGTQALTVLLDELQSCECLELDFGGAAPTPSFADQCVGGLIGRIGVSEFKRRVKIKNAPESSKPLLRHVLYKAQAAVVS